MFFQSLRAKLQESSKGFDIKRLEKAYEFAEKAHKGQRRKSGEPYLVHPVAVAEILFDIGADEDTVIAGFLHDTLEDTFVSYSEIECLFGKSVAELVESVTKVEELDLPATKEELKVETLRKMMMGGIFDERAIVVKLADRMHNVSTLRYLRREKQEKFAEETMSFYHGLARVFGIWQAKRVFENTCFPILHPEEAFAIRKLVDRFKVEKKKHLERTQKSLLKVLPNVQTEIVFYSPYELCKRAKDERIYFEQLRKFFYVDVLVDSIQDCYLALGEIHSHFPWRENSLRDYISIPKNNGYQGLHSTVYLDSGILTEFHVHTRDMHRINDTCSFFLSPESFSREDLKKSLKTLDQNYYTSGQYVDDIQKDVCSRKIFVFTKDGEVVSLPEGATGIDFAYAVDSSTAHALRQVKVNGLDQPVTRPLHSGQTIDVIIGSDLCPDPSWLNHIKTGVAKQAIVQWSAQLSDVDLLKRGEACLRDEFKKYNISYKNCRDEKIQGALLKHFREVSFDDFLKKVGKGFVSAKDFMSVYFEVKKNHRESVVNKMPLLDWFFSVFYMFSTENILNQKSNVLTLKVRSLDRSGMLYDILTVINRRKLNVSGLKIYSLRPSRDAFYKIKLEVYNYRQFSEIFDEIREISGVRNVRRA